MTVTIKAKALEAFVADIFASAGCSTEEGGRIGRYLVSANLSGHDSHGVVRVPRYATQKKNGTVRGRRHRRRRRRHAGDRRGRRQVRLRPDRDAAGRAHRHRQVPQERPRRGDPAQRGPCRPRRRLGRDGGRGGPGLDPFRQCLGQRAGGALSAACSGASRPRPTASACRGRGRIRWCSTSPPRSWPRARCWWRARAARRCRTARWSAPTASRAPIRTCSTATTRRPARATTARAPAPSRPSATTRARASP